MRSLSRFIMTMPTQRPFRNDPEGAFSSLCRILAGGGLLPDNHPIAVLQACLRELGDTMGRDTLYRTPRTPVPPFEFDAAVADVFDDMIHRSVPMYDEIIRRQAQLVERFCRPGTRVYDLGCATGNLAMALCGRMPAGAFEMVAVDSSRPMLDIFKERLNAAGRFEGITPMCSNIRRVNMEQAVVVVVNFTLQFIPPEDRDALIQRIYEALGPCGILLFSEKIMHPNQALSDL